MNLKITYHKENDYIYAVITGVVDQEETAILQKKIAQEIKLHPCKRILLDMQQATVNMETYAIYALPKNAINNGLQDLRRAIIYSDNSQNFSFIETVALNQGQLVKVFTDTKKAIDWLLE